MDVPNGPALRVAAWILIVGGSLAFIGASWPPYRQWYAPEEEGLRIILAHPIGWRCIHAGFVSGTWVCLFGLSLLAYVLRDGAGAPLALLSAVAFGLASVFWTINIGIRLGVTPLAAAELVASGSVPASYAPFRALSRLTFAAFSVLAYLAVAGVGFAVLRSAIAPRWLACTLMAWGMTAGFIVGANVPVIAYIPYILLGIFVLKA